MRPSKTRTLNLHQNFYFKGSLSDTQIFYLDEILKQDSFPKLRDIIPRSAELFKRDCHDITLLDAQTKAVALSYINPYFFIGDKPGLGKTIMSAASYSQYRLKHFESYGLAGLSKLLVITDNNHILGGEREYRNCGINLIPLKDGDAKITRTLKKIDFRDPSIDGIITSWDSIKVTAFLKFYMENMSILKVIIWDETSALKSTDTKLYPIADKISANSERGLFLNASTFEISIMDIFNQYAVLNPTVIPTKKIITDRYVIYGKDSWFQTEYKVANNMVTPERVRKTAMRIADYQNQEELLNRLRYYYIARTKADYSDSLPSKIYRLLPVRMTEKMAHQLSNSFTNYKEILNSPTTLDRTLKFTPTTVPKLGVLLELFKSIYHERPVIYVYNTESQKLIAGELKKLGYRPAIISGKLDGEYEFNESEDKFTQSEKDRLQILDDFKDGFYDCIITNIKKAVSIYGSHAMIFYDIPTNPQITYQIMGRIDRNNYTDDKSYYFLVYLNSPEMTNLSELAYFREHHSSMFTGQYEDVYKQLIMQLENYL